MVHSYGSITEWILSLVKEKRVDMDVVLMLLWALWIEMNNLVWEGKSSDPMEVVQQSYMWLAAKVPCSQLSTKLHALS